ncbi:MAG: ISNCY family transposase, partial [Deltaproteobacteria bacterium]|nr:ISNCY family transposase [Deltaproteobacteria bacterium]
MVVDRYAVDPSFAEWSRRLGIVLTPELEELDKLLDDVELFDLFKRDFQERYPNSLSTGRYSTPVEVLVRGLTLKHAQGWSFEELEEALRNNVMVRKFCRLYFHKAPDDTVLIRWDNELKPSTLEALNGRVVEAARRLKVTRGRKLRTDTTVVETHIHYPSDSSLLADGVRVISRLAKRAKHLVGQIGEDVEDIKPLFRDRMGAVKRRIKILLESSKAKAEAGKARFRKAYIELVDIAKASVNQAQELIGVLNEMPSRVSAPVAEQVERVSEQLRVFYPRVQQVITQTIRRVIDHQVVPAAEKLVSLFEPHTAIIPKEKAGQAVQFGRKVKLDEVDGGIISHYTVEAGNPHDSTLFPDSLDAHRERFEKPPDLAATDRGFWSADNEKKALEAGVKQVVIPKSGRRSKERIAYEH